MGPDTSHPVVVAFGANLGDRLGNLRLGARRLEAFGLGPLNFSSVYETPPLGSVDQPRFLNLVALGRTDLPPRELLAIFLSVETEAGRTESLREGPRPLDLDLLFYGWRIVRDVGLQVPHPRWRERRFVVLPLLEVVPNYRDPETGLMVHEVARRWPLEPKEISVIESAGDFRGRIDGV